MYPALSVRAVTYQKKKNIGEMIVFLYSSGNYMISPIMHYVSMTHTRHKMEYCFYICDRATHSSALTEIKCVCVDLWVMDYFPPLQRTTRKPIFWGVIFFNAISSHPYS